MTKTMTDLSEYSISKIYVDKKSNHKPHCIDLKSSIKKDWMDGARICYGTYNRCYLILKYPFNSGEDTQKKDGLVLSDRLCRKFWKEISETLNPTDLEMLDDYLTEKEEEN